MFKIWRCFVIELSEVLEKIKTFIYLDFFRIFFVECRTMIENLSCFRKRNKEMCRFSLMKSSKHTRIKMLCFKFILLRVRKIIVGKVSQPSFLSTSPTMGRRLISIVTQWKLMKALWGHLERMKLLKLKHSHLPSLRFKIQSLPIIGTLLQGFPHLHMEQIASWFQCMRVASKNIKDNIKDYWGNLSKLDKGMKIILKN